jgi:hypothetical protein
MTTFNVVGNETVPVQDEEPVQQGSGYFGATSPASTEYSQEVQAQQGNDLQLVNELQERLGVNFNDVPQPNQVVQPQQVPEVQQQEDFVKKFNSAEGQRMRNEFKQIMGIDPVEAFQAVQNTQAQLKEIENWRRQVANEKQIETLQNEWGSNFEETWSGVRERFQTLPDNMKQALDNLEGARLLAAQIRLEQGSNQGRVQQSFQKSSSGNNPTQNIRTSGNVGGFIKTSDYLADKVDEATYIKAVRNGRVIYDVH